MNEDPRCIRDYDHNMDRLRIERSGLVSALGVCGDEVFEESALRASDLGIRIDFTYDIDALARKGEVLVQRDRNNEAINYDTLLDFLTPYDPDLCARYVELKNRYDDVNNQIRDLVASLGD